MIGTEQDTREGRNLAFRAAKFANTQCVYNRYIKRGRGRPGHRPQELAKLPEEPRYWTVGTGSGPGGDASFAWSWVLKHLYPKDPVVDYGFRHLGRWRSPIIETAAAR